MLSLNIPDKYYGAHGTCDEQHAEGLASILISYVIYNGDGGMDQYF